MSVIENLEDKFIVINKKRFEELAKRSPDAVDRFKAALRNFESDYLFYTGFPMSQKYIVCNQDEPYAEEVARIILESDKSKNWKDPAVEADPTLRSCVCGKSLISIGTLRKKWPGHQYAVLCENCGREAMADTREQAINLWNGGDHGIHNG
jgi:hypothetical protein